MVFAILPVSMLWHVLVTPFVLLRVLIGLRDARPMGVIERVLVAISAFGAVSVLLAVWMDLECASSMTWKLGALWGLGCLMGALPLVWEPGRAFGAFGLVLMLFVDAYAARREIPGLSALIPLLSFFLHVALLVRYARGPISAAGTERAFQTISRPSVGGNVGRGIRRSWSMTGQRFVAIVFIFGAVSAAWMALGGSTFVRTEKLDEDLSAEMQSLWGPKVLAQTHPYYTAQPDLGRDAADVLQPIAAEISADIHHENRYKGLLWYSTFTVDFVGRYTLPGVKDGQNGTFCFDLPRGATPMDLSVIVGSGDSATAQEIPYRQKLRGALRLDIPLTDKPTDVTVRFRTAGQDTWAYFPAGVMLHDEAGRSSRDLADWDGYSESDTGGKPTWQGKMGELRDFSLTVTTDFAQIDYPRGSRSPNEPAADADGGKRAAWDYENLVTAQPMGVVMPARANAGPIVARMSFFAPVSLFFFFTVLFTVVVLKKIQLHPMHYLFIAAGFFAFHILLAYTADKISIHLAFWISAVVSVILVVSYLRLVGGAKFAVLYAGAAQLVYLVGFSYAFFWVGMTGLTVVVVAILTLFVLMQATGRLNWAEVFAKKNPDPSPELEPDDL